ncbi:hypothetical protein VB711_06965 [Cronbergia sp. UHCC 0137]|uniref:hypothetical protein n=1 Tax=Cronbergia sp. UHCC 0137 TaxID=3110239 RepID=UPI002B1EFAA6|nr:hypothetical protein [Cronbergia sp. UHCC 0137]MEA5617579.1 hypothetical protein [Cronbergia sp. UHCC 0137]
MKYIEIKARKTTLYPADIEKIISKGCVSGILTTGKISNNAKKLLDQAGIAWAENIEERQFLESEAEELE